MKLRFSDMQSQDGKVSIDVQYRIVGSNLVVTDFTVFLSNNDGWWDEIINKTVARQLFDKYGLNLMEQEINRNEIDFDYEIVS